MLLKLSNFYNWDITITIFYRNVELSNRIFNKKGIPICLMFTNGVQLSGNRNQGDEYLTTTIVDL